MRKKLSSEAQNTRYEESARKIGKRIRWARHDRGMRMQDLADRIGRHTTWVSQVERAEWAPNIVDLLEIAKVLEYPLGFFVGEELPPRPNRPEDWALLFPDKPDWAESFAQVHRVLIGAERRAELRVKAEA